MVDSTALALAIFIASLIFAVKSHSYMRNTPQETVRESEVFWWGFFQWATVTSWLFLVTQLVGTLL